MIETATGAIAPERLGVTLMHEHVFVLSPEVAQNYDTGWDEQTRVRDAVRRLDELKSAGVDTIVDLTVVGLGRYVPRIQRVAAATELSIVVATGLYTYDELPHYFTRRRTDVLADLFVADIVEGIAGTGVRAGILKCATDEKGLTRGVERVLRAVARAHRRTGVPISTHTHAGTERGRDQQRVLADEGVDLSRVVIGHSGDSTDIGYLESLLARGSYLGMDRFGIDTILPFEQRVETVAALCRRGHAERLVLSHDAACHLDWYPAGVVEAVTPNWHFLHITRDVLPALRARGVSQEQIHQMLVANPQRILAATGSY